MLATIKADVITHNDDGVCSEQLMVSATDQSLSFTQKVQEMETATIKSSIAVDTSEDVTSKSDRIVAGIWDDEVIVADIGGEAASQFFS